MEKIIVSCPNCQAKVFLPEGKKVKYNCPKCNSEVIYDNNPEVYVVKNEDSDKSNPVVRFILGAVEWLILIPIVLIIHKLIPSPEWPLHLDRILVVLVAAILVKLLLYFFRHFVVALVIFVIIYLSYGTYKGGYSFKSLFIDYSAIVFALWDSDFKPTVIPSGNVWFPESDVIKGRIDFDHPDVRNFALTATNNHFKEEAQTSHYRELIQYFAVFKAINSGWNYVNDPKSREYFAYGSESVKHLSGDCDDHSILMAACIKAIGGTTRIIRTEGHVYPELLIGKKRNLETINYLIKNEFFPFESIGEKINYHVDENGDYWLNLDYTANYPGGEFMHPVILGILIVK